MYGILDTSTYFNKSKTLPEKRGFYRKVQFHAVVSIWQGTTEVLASRGIQEDVLSEPAEQELPVWRKPPVPLRPM